MITIEVAGQEYTDFLSAGVDRSVDTLTGAFSLRATAKAGDTYPIRVGQSCKVFVSGVKQIDGFVESVDVGYSAGSHTISISGRDKSADLIDSTIGPNIDLKGPITLAGICKAVIKAMGISISVIDNTSDLKPFADSEIASAEIDKQGFAFLESFARQRQVFLTGDGTGNLVVTRAGLTKAGTGLQNILEGQKNNIKESSSSNDISLRFNLYDVAAQLNVSAFDTEVSSTDIANQNGSALDGDIRASRRLYFQAEKSADGNTSKERATWEANIRRARSSKYSAIVAGFQQEDGSLWALNQLVNVNDDFADIRADMLVWALKFRYSVDGGSTTSIDLVPPDALKLIAEEPVSQKKTDTIGAVFDE